MRFVVTAAPPMLKCPDYRIRECRDQVRPHVVHAGQGHKVGLHTPTILGGNSHQSWFYDRGAIKDPAHTGTSKGIAHAIKRGPIRKFLSNYANVYVTIQSHALSAGVRTHYVTANGVRNGLGSGAGTQAMRWYNMRVVIGRVYSAYNSLLTCFKL